MMTIVLTTITTMIINSDDYSGDVVADQTDLGTESQFPTMPVMRIRTYKLEKRLNYRIRVS